MTAVEAQGTLGPEGVTMETEFKSGTWRIGLDVGPGDHAARRYGNDSQSSPE